MTAEQFYTLELNEWKRTIDFYLSELGIFTERLTEVARKNNRQPVVSGIESFENQFIAQKEALQTLKHDVNKQRESVTAEVKKEGNMQNLDVVDDEFLLRDRVQMAEKMLLELKHSFYRFLSKIL